MSDCSSFVKGSIHIIDCQGFFKFFQRNLVSPCKAIVNAVDVGPTIDKGSGVDVLSM